ncbi:SPOR domain-containing protein [Pseudoalteromonas sp. SG43-7]|uniref:SPOR domain-containing protein n=1 Tax=Pseudoalteromonas sp. SG43-7 TaxID=2760966 RepID=UPI002175CFEE|nr:SPOR domain-containing protein [Pseudoalteromonas sp. SG43-7]
MMCFKKQTWYTTVLVTATVWLSGCSSINANPVEQQPALISDQQVKEYVQQWHSQQESITRLAAMEEDLQLLIMALSSQTDIAENPAVLREDNVTVAHYAEKIQIPDTANSSKTIENRPLPLYGNSLPGAQLGLYLKPQRVRTQIARLQQQYPQAFSQLDFVMTERHNKGVTLYGLRVGPFQNYTEANLFCSLAQNLGQKCLSAPFVGQPL